MPNGRNLPGTAVYQLNRPIERYGPPGARPGGRLESSDSAPYWK